jgi:hypothetical protein
MIWAVLCFTSLMVLTSLPNRDKQGFVLCPYKGVGSALSDKEQTNTDPYFHWKPHIVLLLAFTVGWYDWTKIRLSSK